MAIFRKKEQPQPPSVQGELPGMPEAVTPQVPKRFGQFPLKESSVTRRGFLMRSLFWVTAAIGAVLAAMGLGAITAPALRKSDDQWSPIGRPGDPGPGEPDLAVEGIPHLTSFTSLVQDAYMAAAPQQIPVFVTNNGNDDFTIFDVRCTHLGCPVAWNDKSKVFDCPCHGATFAQGGEVESGPPNRPLDRYTYKLENGVLYAGHIYAEGEATGPTGEGA